MSKTAICNKCEEEFEIYIEATDHGKGIIETYFTCTHCNEVYPVTVTNEAIRDRITKANAEWIKLNRLKNGKNWTENAWMAKHDRLKKYKAVTTEMIDKLKGEIGR